MYQPSSLQIHNYSISLGDATPRRSTNSRSRSPQLTNENDTRQTSPLPIPHTRAVPDHSRGIVDGCCTVGIPISLHWP